MVEDMCHWPPADIPRIPLALLAEAPPVLRSCRRRALAVDVSQVWGWRLAFNPRAQDDCMFQSFAYGATSREIDGRDVRSLCVEAWQHPSMHDLLVRTSRVENMTTSRYLKSVSENMWGGKPDWTALAMVLGFRIAVWSPTGDLLFIAGDSGPFVNLGLAFRHYVCLKPVGVAWWLQTVGSSLRSRCSCMRGGMPSHSSAVRSPRCHSRSPRRSRTSSVTLTPSPAGVALEYQCQKLLAIRRLPQASFDIEKTWIALKAWGQGTPWSGWSAWCALCHRWCEGHRASQRHLHRVIENGLLEAPLEESDRAVDFLCYCSEDCGESFPSKCRCPSCSSAAS